METDDLQETHNAATVWAVQTCRKKLCAKEAIPLSYDAVCTARSVRHFVRMLLWNREVYGFVKRSRESLLETATTLKTVGGSTRSSATFTLVSVGQTRNVWRKRVSSYCLGSVDNSTARWKSLVRTICVPAFLHIDAIAHVVFGGCNAPETLGPIRPGAGRPKNPLGNAVTNFDRPKFPLN